MTCSLYKRNTKDKEEKPENDRKKCPRMVKNQNFEKKMFFFSCPKEYYAKKLGS